MLKIKNIEDDSKTYFEDLKVGEVFRVVDVGTYIKIQLAPNHSGSTYNALDLNSYEAVDFRPRTEVVIARSAELTIDWR